MHFSFLTAYLYDKKQWNLKVFLHLCFHEINWITEELWNIWEYLTTWASCSRILCLLKHGRMSYLYVYSIACSLTCCTLWHSSYLSFLLYKAWKDSLHFNIAFHFFFPYHKFFKFCVFLTLCGCPQARNHSSKSPTAFCAWLHWVSVLYTGMICLSLQSWAWLSKASCPASQTSELTSDCIFLRERVCVFSFSFLYYRELNVILPDQ